MELGFEVALFRYDREPRDEHGKRGGGGNEPEVLGQLGDTEQDHDIAKINRVAEAGEWSGGDEIVGRTVRLNRGACPIECPDCP